jgi:glycosyltransferase involved in cell wall biosynthesis
MIFNLAIFTSHPIQYQAPLFKKISAHPDIDLTVYFRKRKGAIAYEDKGFGTTVKWDIPLLKGYKHIFISGAPHLIREIKNSTHHAVIIYGWNSLTNLLAGAGSKARGAKVFIYSETPHNQEVRKRGILQKTKRALLRILFSGASGFLYIGEENKKFYQLLGIPERKLFHTPYAVNNERFMRERKREKGKPTILFVGKLIEKKHPFDLLKAFEPLHKKAKLVFVGDGQLKSKLEKHVQEKKIKNVHFTRFINQCELPQHYAKADIFVLPSGMGETWGLVVNEAMCAGLPVITSDLCGCAPDLVRHGKNGFVYPVGNIEKLMQCIKTLVEDKEMRESFGRVSYSVIQEYSYKKNVEGILKALNETFPKKNQGM